MSLVSVGHLTSVEGIQPGFDQDDLDQCRDVSFFGEVQYKDQDCQMCETEFHTVSNFFTFLTKNKKNIRDYSTWAFVEHFLIWL